RQRHRRVPGDPQRRPDDQGPHPHLVRGRRGALRGDHGRCRGVRPEADQGQRPGGHRPPGGGRAVAAGPGGDAACARPEPSPRRGAPRAACPDRAGAPHPGARRGRPDQPGDRREDVPRREDGEELRLQHAGEAGGGTPDPGGGARLPPAGQGPRLRPGLRAEAGTPRLRPGRLAYTRPVGSSTSARRTSVKSTVETLSPTRVRLAIEVPFAELEPSLRKAYRAIAQQVNIPGFRRGRAPAAVIDRRIGRGVVLNEAVQEVVPQQLYAALREHQVKSIGRPEVGNVEFDDGQPLRFTAEVDVRPEIDLPDLGEITVTVDEITVTDDEVEQQLNALRDRFATLRTVSRPAGNGDYVQIDLEARVDGQVVEGGTATNVSHEVGSGRLLDGLDEVLVGMSAGDQTTFRSTLVGGEYAGREADVTVTVRSVKEKELPPLDDDFAQLASEFDTLDQLRADIRQRVERGKRLTQLYTARDRALDALLERTGVPAPEG